MLCSVGLELSTVNMAFLQIVFHVTYSIFYTEVPVLYPPLVIHSENIYIIYCILLHDRVLSINLKPTLAFY